MACDAKVKSLLVDQDGTFLGTPGSVIPQSEHEWNGDKRMGLGDYRIPKEMQTRLDGTRIPVSELAPNKGQGESLRFCFELFKIYLMILVLISVNFLLFLRAIYSFHVPVFNCFWGN